MARYDIDINSTYSGGGLEAATRNMQQQAAAAQSLAAAFLPMSTIGTTINGQFTDIAAGLGRLASSFKTNVAGIVSDARQLGDQIRASLSGVILGSGGLGPSIMSSFQQLQRVAGQVFSQIGTAAVNAGKSIASSIGSALAGMPAQLVNIGRSIAVNVGQAAVSAAGVVRNTLVGAWNAVTGAIGAATAAVGGFVARIQGLLASIAGIGGILGVLGFAAATKQAADFEEQLYVINTIARVTPDILNDAIGSGLRDIAADTGESLADLGQGFYDLLSAGLGFQKNADGTRSSIVDVNGSLQLMNDATHLAVGGLGSVSQALDLMTTLMNSFGLDTKDSTYIVDLFAKAVENGKVTVAELSEEISTIAPIAAAVGVNLEEVAAGFAQMTAAGFAPEKAATAMRSFIAGIQRDSEALQNAAIAMGVDWEEVLDTQGMGEAARLMVQYSEESGVPLIDMLGRIEGVQFALAATGDNTTRWKQNLEDMFNAGGTAAEQFDVRMGTLTRSWQMFVESVRSLAIVIGTPLLAPLANFLHIVSDIVQAITEWLEVHKEIVPIISQVGAVVSTLLALRFGAAMLTRVLSPLGGVFAMFGTQLSGFMAIIGKFVWPVALIVGAFLAFKTAVEQNFMGLGVLKDVLDGIKNVLFDVGRIAGDVGNFLGDLFDAVFNGGDVDFSGAQEAIGTAIGYLFEDLSKLAGDIWTHVRDGLIPMLQQGIQAAVDAIPGLVSGAAALVGAFVSWVADAAPGVFAAGLELAGQVIDGIAGALPGIVDTLASWAGAFFAWIGPVVSDIAGSLGAIAQEIIAWIVPRAQDFIAMLGTWADAFLGWIGNDVIPAIGPALATVIDAISKWVGENVPGIIDAVAELGRHFFDWVNEEVLPQVGPAIGSIITAIGDWLRINGPAIVEAFKSIADGAISWVADVLPKLQALSQQFIGSIATWLQQNQGGIIETFGKVSDWLWDAVVNHWIPAIMDGLGKLAAAFNEFVITKGPLIVAGIIGLGALIVGRILDGIVKAIGDIFTPKIKDHLQNALENASILLDLTLAGAAIATALSAAMFVADLFAKAFAAIFRAPAWLAMKAVGGVVWVAGEILGALFRTAMFIGEVAVSALARAATGAIGAIAVDGGVVAATAGSGTTLGGIFAGAMALALPALLVIAFAALAETISPTVNQAGTDIGRALFGAFGDEAKGLLYGTVLDSVIDFVHLMWETLNQLPWPFGSGRDEPKNLGVPQSFIDQGTAAGTAAGTAGGQASLEAWLYQWNSGIGIEGIGHGDFWDGQWFGIGSSGAWGVKTAFETTMAGAPIQINNQGFDPQTWTDAGHEGVDAFTTAMTDAQASAMVKTQTQQLQQLLDTAMSPIQQLMEAQGNRALLLFQRGMASNVDGIVTFSRNMALHNMEVIVNAFNNGGGPTAKGMHAIGVYAMGLLADGMNAKDVLLKLTGMGASQEVIDGLISKYPQFFNAGDGAADKVITAFQKPDWYHYGSLIGGQWVSGYQAAIGAVNWDAWIKKHVGPEWFGGSPAKRGPFHNIFQYGYGIGATWAGGYQLGVADNLGPEIATFATMPDKTLRVESYLEVKLTDPDNVAARAGYTSDDVSRDVQTGAAALYRTLRHQSQTGRAG